MHYTKVGGKKWLSFLPEYQIKTHARFKEYPHDDDNQDHINHMKAEQNYQLEQKKNSASLLQIWRKSFEEFFQQTGH